MNHRFASLALPLFFLAGCISTPPASSSLVSFEKISLDTDFPALTDFRFLPDSLNFIALNRSGKVGYFEMQGDRARMIGSMVIPDVHSGADCGASSMALDPDFRENGFFYVSFCVDQQSSAVMRYSFDGTYFGPGAEVIRAGDPLATRSIHGAGAINFDSAKAMLVSFGEKGRGENSQDLANPLGKIIRIMPNRDPEGSGYSIPADNPFAGDDPADDMVFAYGLRNPWRASFDTAGRYWIADVGSVAHEEINVSKVGGENFGWPKSEGVCKEECESIVDPVVSYDHSANNPLLSDDMYAKKTTKFRVAWVGIEYVPGDQDRYRGLLTGKMLYGDWYLGWMRAASLSQSGGLEGDANVGHLTFPVSFQQASNGYVYSATMFGAIELDEDGNPKITNPSDMNGVLWRMVLTSDKDDGQL